jgi:selenide,water dikinase
MCSGSKVGAEIRVNSVPLLAGTREYLARGFRPAGTIRNADGFRSRVDVRVDNSEYILMCDAQTSGGLLISVPPEKLGAIETAFREGGLFYANVGKVTDQSGSVTLTH